MILRMNSNNNAIQKDFHSQSEIATAVQAVSEENLNNPWTLVALRQ